MKLFEKKVETTITPAEAKEIHSLYIFTGSENGMFAYHFAMALQAGKKSISVLLIDNSEKNDLFNAVPHKDENGSVGTATVVRNRIFTPSANDKFDVTIAYLGYNIDKEYIDAADKVFIMCDYSPKSRNFLKTAQFPEGKCQMLFYNRCSAKLRENTYILDLPKNIIDKETVMVCEDDIEDIGRYQMWELGESEKLSSMSEDYRNVVVSITAAYFNAKPSDVAKAVKKI